MLVELKDSPFVYTLPSGEAFLVAIWGGNPWLFRWHLHQREWVSLRQLKQMDVWLLAGLTDKEAESRFPIPAHLRTTK